MKNTPIIPYIFCCLGLLLLSACDKDPSKPGYQGKPPKPEYYRIKMNEELKSYLWSKPGSYWIYKNTKTGDLDTHIIRSFYFDSILVKGIYPYSKHRTIYYDIMTRSFYSTFIKDYYYEYTRTFNPQATDLYITSNKIYREGNGSINTPFVYPFVLGTGSGNGSSNTTYIGMDSTLTIQGKTYQNVAKFDIDKDDIWEEKLNCIRSNNIYYWAKDVGLIKKKSISCNYSWELIEYNIIK
jgi:hypothetical protein